jgi:hypothetical protein
VRLNPKNHDGEMMNQSEYESGLLEALAGQRATVTERLRLVLANLPPNVTELEITIYPYQDGEGSFAIQVSLSGPNLYILNKAIKDHAELLAILHTESGFEPPVPMVDPFSIDYLVNDIIVDTAATWLKEIWDSIGNPDPGIPVWITSHDEYGTITPFELPC